MNQGPEFHCGSHPDCRLHPGKADLTIFLKHLYFGRHFGAHMSSVAHQTIQTSMGIIHTWEKICLCLNILASGSAGTVNKALLWYANIQDKWNHVWIKCLARQWKSWSHFVFVQSVVPHKGADCWELWTNSVPNLHLRHTQTRGHSKGQTPSDVCHSSNSVQFSLSVLTLAN